MKKRKRRLVLQGIKEKNPFTGVFTLKKELVTLLTAVEHKVAIKIIYIVLDFLVLEG
jgi:hypothetical protein